MRITPKYQFSCLIVCQANQPRPRPDSNLGLTNFYPELAKICNIIINKSLNFSYKEEFQRLIFRY